MMTVRGFGGPARAGGGYSLLALVIALGMFAAGLLAIIALTPGGTASVRRTRDETRAATLAERELALIRSAWGAAGASPPAEISGEEADGYRWSARISGDGLYTVVLTVSWEEEGRTREEVFKTRFFQR